MNESIELEDLKKIEIEILNYVDEICKKEGIDYSLGYGTLLGAVRHKGFIPWDDDIDLILTRENYERLKKALIRENNKEFLFVDHTTCKNYCIPFAKVYNSKTESIEKWAGTNEIGVYIDLFPIDMLPKHFQWISIVLAQLLFRINMLCNYDFDRNKPVLKFLSYAIQIVTWNKQQWCILLDKLAKSCQNKQNKKCGNYSFIDKKGLFDSKIFNIYDSIIFENKKYKTIADWDSFLKTRYGNYMIPPDINNRQSTHTLHFRWNNND